ncbi:MAG: carboxypeptidase-like regulatory domain-containing protein, partial [Bacteroidaceae bacterium]|nr:carboxypeptidase-like regulatory domain-containing protein [Bacteroidaceae bacterium]
MLKAKLLQISLAVLMLCGMPLSVFAQGNVRGTVNDVTGEPIIGASVKVVGTTRGAVTDLNGAFTVAAGRNDRLEISYVGYATQVVAVNGRQLIAVVLEEDSEVLSDVVVIGYGVQKKKLVTGATVQVKGADLAKLNTTNPLEAMQSQTPG